MYEFYLFLSFVIPVIFLMFSLRKRRIEVISVFNVNEKILIGIFFFISGVSYFITVWMWSYLAYDLTCTTSHCYDGFFDFVIIIFTLPVSVVSAILYGSATANYLFIRRGWYQNILSLILLVLVLPLLVYLGSFINSSSKIKFSNIQNISPGFSDPDRIENEEFIKNLFSEDSSTYLNRIYRDFDRRYVAFSPSFKLNSSKYIFTSEIVNGYDFLNKKVTLYRTFSGDTSPVPITSFASRTSNLPDVFALGEGHLILVWPLLDNKVDFIKIDLSQANILSNKIDGAIETNLTSGFNPFGDESGGKFLFLDNGIIFGGYFTQTKSLYYYDFITKNTKLLLVTKNPGVCVIDNFAVKENKIFWQEIPNISNTEHKSFNCFSYSKSF